MYYTISEVAKKFNLTISTLRYYDNEGLFPNLERKSGVRMFQDREIETIRVIECLKKSGLEIKKIKHFMELCQKGSSTYKERKKIFDKQQELVNKEIKKLKNTLNMLKFKSWYYEQALIDGNEERLKQIIPDKLPSNIKKIYNKSHKK